MKRSKTKMTLISGGKQLSFIRQTEEVIRFLEHHGFVEEMTLCEWFFSLLSEEEDNLHWILENREVISSRQELISADELERRIQEITEAIQHFLSWSSDPIGWEQTRKSKKETVHTGLSMNRTLTFPLSAKKMIEIRLPREGISQEDFKKLGLFLFPYCIDLDLTKTKSWGDDYPEPPLPRTCT